MLTFEKFITYVINNLNSQFGTLKYRSDYIQEEERFISFCFCVDCCSYKVKSKQTNKQEYV